MDEMESILRAVESSMRMEGMPLVPDDRKRIQACLKSPETFTTVKRGLITKWNLVAKWHAAEKHTAETAKYECD